MGAAAGRAGLSTASATVQTRVRAARPSSSRAPSRQKASADRAARAAVMAARAAWPASGEAASMISPVSQAPSAAFASGSCPCSLVATPISGGRVSSGSTPAVGQVRSPARARTMAWRSSASEAPTSRAARAARPSAALARGSAQASASPSQREMASITAWSFADSTGAASAAVRRARISARRVSRTRPNSGLASSCASGAWANMGATGAARAWARLERRPARKALALASSSNRPSDQPRAVSRPA